MQWKQPMWVEIVALSGGQLYVGGDIDSCIFGNYVDSNDPKDKIKWLGSHEHCDEYVVEKACIGMGSHWVYRSDQDQLKVDIQRVILDLRENGLVKDSQTVETFAFKSLSEDVFLHEFSESVEDWHDYMSKNFGKIVTPAVEIAHAAIRRLHTLLPKKDPSLRSVQMNLSLRTIQSIQTVGELTGSRSEGDAIAYMAELTKIITRGAKAGKKVYIGEGDNREVINIPGI